MKRLVCAAVLVAALQAQEAGPDPGRSFQPGGARVSLGLGDLGFQEWNRLSDQLDLRGFHDVQRQGSGPTHRTGLDVRYFPFRWLGVRLALEQGNAQAFQAIPEPDGPWRDRPGAGLGIMIRF